MSLWTMQPYPVLKAEFSGNCAPSCGTTTVTMRRVKRYGLLTSAPSGIVLAAAATTTTTTLLLIKSSAAASTMVLVLVLVLILHEAFQQA